MAHHEVVVTALVQQPRQHARGTIGGVPCRHAGQGPRRQRPDLAVPVRQLDVRQVPEDGRPVLLERGDRRGQGQERCAPVAQRVVVGEGQDLDAVREVVRALASHALLERGKCRERILHWYPWQRTNTAESACWYPCIKLPGTRRRPPAGSSPPGRTGRPGRARRSARRRAAAARRARRHGQRPSMCSRLVR